MRVYTISLMASALVLNSCTSMPNHSDVRQGIESFAYVQYGTEPIKYGFRVVDGKSFWGNGEGNGVQPGLLLAVGLEAAKAAAEAEEKKLAAAIISSMLGQHNPVAEMKNKVMPVLAKTWNLPFNPKSITYLPSTSPLEDEAGYYLGKGLKKDLLIVYSVDLVELSEQQSIGGFFDGMVTAGFNDKSVAPTIMASVKVYKYDAISGKNKKIWWKNCLAHSLHAPSTVKYSVIKDNPEKGRSVMQDSMAVFVDNCKQAMSN